MQVLGNNDAREATARRSFVDVLDDVPPPSNVRVVQQASSVHSEQDPPHGRRWLGKKVVKEEKVWDP